MLPASETHGIGQKERQAALTRRKS